MTHSLQVILLLTLVVAAAKTAGALATRIHQPSVFGEILVGLLLGPTLLNVLAWPMFAPPAGVDALSLLDLVRDLAQVGVLLLMFVAGLETDLVMMRHVGRVAFWSAFGGVILPMLFGAITAVTFGLPLYWEGVFVGAILTATSVSISAQTLLEIGAMRTREGSTILGAAVIDDVMGIIVLSLVVALAKASGAGLNWSELGIVVVRVTIYFVAAIAARRLLTPALRWASTLGVSQAVLSAGLVIMFLYAWAAEYLGAVAAITGSYLAGVLIAQTDFKKEIDAGIHPLTYSIFVPLFFISIGLEANARDLGPRAMFTVVLVLVAIVAKAIGCGVFARLFGFSTTESVRVGVGMISRGEVGLIVAGYGLANGLIGSDVFSASVLMVLVTTMVTPPLMRLVFPRHAFVSATVEETIAGPPEEGEAPA
ncbi:MAG TPA: cation:proton antiporter [Vicinamibacterales bacterium]|nr:cation:proton antiporter [Vicinamibacterales bacterium]